MIIQSDCLQVMKTFSDNSIDFIVTDPPYGLKFMGKKWDHGIPGVEYWTEALRICKPGSFLAAFGGTRTFHRLTCAIEDAGWIIRDCVTWLYGSGFPKSHNKFGLEGYGTALKPAWEPIILASKPLDGTYAQNVEKWGIGGINIDGCRIEGKKRKVGCINPGTRSEGNSLWNNSSLGIRREVNLSNGRWPANLILDEEAAEALDNQTGILKSGSGIKNPIGGSTKGFHTSNWRDSGFTQADSGGASRFFYCAKASSKERNSGLEGMELKNSKRQGDRGPSANQRPNTHNGVMESNNHPTVKPLSLMRYILKLLAPPNNPIVLDPFAGSGSTLCAAKQLGIRHIGIELEKDYCDIAHKRLDDIKELAKS